MKQTDIYQVMEAGKIKGLWLVATNPMTSLPNTGRVRKAMEQLEFCCVQDSYEDTNCNEYAHVYLPAGTGHRVALGQRTIAGETVIARLGEADRSIGAAQ